MKLNFNRLIAKANNANSIYLLYYLYFLEFFIPTLCFLDSNLIFKLVLLIYKNQSLFSMDLMRYNFWLNLTILMILTRGLKTAILITDLRINHRALWISRFYETYQNAVSYSIKFSKKSYNDRFTVLFSFSYDTELYSLFSDPSKLREGYASRLKHVFEEPLSNSIPARPPTDQFQIFSLVNGMQGCMLECEFPISISRSHK
jgi:hypothetical protein